MAGARLLQYIEQRLGVTYDSKSRFEKHTGNVIDFLRDALLSTKHQPKGLQWLYEQIPDTLIKNMKRKSHLRENEVCPPISGSAAAAASHPVQDMQRHGGVTSATPQRPPAPLDPAGPGPTGNNSHPLPPPHTKEVCFPV